jgi:hypothetical protein
VALQLQYPNPYDPAPLAAAFAKVSRLDLDFDRRAGLVVVSVWSSRAAADAGLPPVGSETFLVTPDGAGDSLSFGRMHASAATLASDPPGTPAYDVVRRTLYQALKGRSPFAAAQDA